MTKTVVKFAEIFKRKIS